MFYGILRAFDETARAKSIRKASQTLGVAPSSVSRNVAILEREMGTLLLERRRDGIELTHAGELVAAYARSVLLDYDSLRADLDEMRGTRRKLLRLALVGSVATHGPINALARVSERFPGIAFNVRVMQAPDVFRGVIEDRCDVGAAYCAEPNPEVLTLASIPEPVVVAVNPDHPVAAKREIELEALSGIALALPDHDTVVRGMIDRGSATRGFRFTPALTSNDFEMLLGFARMGAGAAIVPMRAAVNHEKFGSIKTVPLSEPPFRNATIDIIVLRRRRLPRLVKAFVDALIGEIKAAV